MKTILFLSSIFFLLGLKVSSLIDIRGKASAVDQIITTKIIRSKPVKAFPLFSGSEENKAVKENKTREELSVSEAEKQNEHE